jgi:two-component system OmpR family sensor kinase
MRSLTSRLVVATVALVAIVALAIGTATTIAMKTYLTDRLDREVIDSAHVAMGPDDDAPGSSPLGDAQRGQSDGTVTAWVPADESIGAVGWVLTRAAVGPPTPNKLASEAVALLAAVPVDGQVHEVDLPHLGDYRVTAFSGLVVNGTAVTVVSGRPSSEVDDVISSLIWWEILLALLGICAAGAAGLFVVRRQLAPLREVAATAHEVAALPLSSGEVDLSARVHAPDERTEVGQVGAALNTLLAHVESSLGARHRSEQQVRQFVADASHELRTPLSTIRGYAELASRTPDDAGALSTSLAKVSAEADRMSTLVEDLLLLARLDSGRPLEREPVDLTHLLLEAVTDARLLGPEHQWRLELPEEPVEIIGDAQRLHQVVTNLLGNARRHTPAGTTVTVRAAQDQAGAVVEVADDGPGFPPEIAEHAFERFTRADVARTRTSGSVGLGLSIVEAIVAAHGGSVTLSSGADGARVTVRLPGLPGPLE